MHFIKNQTKPYVSAGRGKGEDDKLMVRKGVRKECGGSKKAGERVGGGEREGGRVGGRRVEREEEGVEGG